MSIAYYPIFGKPFLLYLGVLAASILLLTASIAILSSKGIHRMPMSWHVWAARATIALALLHGLLALTGL